MEMPIAMVVHWKCVLAGKNSVGRNIGIYIEQNPCHVIFKCQRRVIEAAYMFEGRAKCCKNTISQSNPSALTRIFSLLDKQLGSTNLCFAGTFDPATREKKLQTIIN